MEDIDDEDLVQIIGDSKLRRRIYDRKKQRRYREQLLTETTQLKSLIIELEQQIATLALSKHIESKVQSEPGLPWKEVALALRDDLNAQSMATQKLEQEIAIYRNLVAKMSTWVSSSRNLERPLRTVPSWCHVTLLADPPARQCGMDWITKQLYYNTDAMFERFAFPNEPHALADDMYMDYSDPDCYQCVHRFQHEVYGPPHAMAKMMAYNVWMYCMVGAMLPSTTTKCVVNDEILRHIIQTPLEYANLISRAFIGDDPRRAVVVGQQIHNDETEPHDFRQRQRLIWVSYEEVEPNLTRLRLLYMTSQSFSKDGYTPLEEEAPMWRCDLSHCDTEELKLVHFRAYVKSLYDDLGRRGKTWLTQELRSHVETPSQSYQEISI